MNKLLLSACVAVLTCVSVGKLAGQANDLFTCELLPLERGCETRLADGQKTVALTVQLLESVRTSAVGSLPEVTVSASHCCLDTVPAIVDRNGFVSFRWIPEATPKTPVTITLLSYASGLRRGQVTIHPPEEASIRSVKVHELDDDHAYVWIRGDYVPRPIWVDIDSIGGRPIDEAQCAQIKYRFLPLQGGTASPDSGFTQFDSAHHGAPRPVCTAETRWKLADAAGEQQLLVDFSGTRIQRQRVQVSGLARQGPRLSGGVGWFQAHRGEREITCNSRDQHSACSDVPADSFPATRKGNIRDESVEPYFAVELPIFFAYESHHELHKYLFEHVRLVLGSTFEQPEENYFVGLALLPLFSSASEYSPFQINAGHSKRGWYAGMSLDASTIVKPIFSVFGFTGL